MEDELAPTLSISDWRYLGRCLGYKPAWANYKYSEARSLTTETEQESA